MRGPPRVSGQQTRLMQRKASVQRRSATRVRARGWTHRPKPPPARPGPWPHAPDAIARQGIAPRARSAGPRPHTPAGRCLVRPRWPPRPAASTNPWQPAKPPIQGRQPATAHASPRLPRRCPVCRFRGRRSGWGGTARSPASANPRPRHWPPPPSTAPAPSRPAAHSPQSRVDGRVFATCDDYHRRIQLPTAPAAALL